MIERYHVKVRRTDGKPIPAHPAMNNHQPDAESFYHFPFITRRPRFPAPSIPGTCRYVEDFLAVYGNENVVVRQMGAVNENWLASIERARITEEQKEKK